MRISDWSSDVCSSDLPSPVSHKMARHSRLPRFPQWGPLHLGIRTDMSTYVIQMMLGALEEYYSHADHEEIAVNQPVEVWCRRHRADEPGKIGRAEGRERVCQYV